MLKFLRKTALWIVLAPAVIWGTGLLSNQAVLIANHDTFPVKVNDYKINQYAAHLIAASQSDDEDEATEAQFRLQALDRGYLDDVHVIMTPKTHLNFLADDFDLDNIYSVGDFLLMLGEWLQTFAIFVWVFEAVRRLRQE
jgi:hypothetical protein